MLNKLARNKFINKIFVALTSLFYSYYDFVFFKKSKAKGVRHVYANKMKRLIVNLIKEKYSDYYCIFTKNGIGDVFFTASLINKFKRINHGKIAYFTEKKSIANFIKAFPSVDEVVFDKNFVFLQCEQALQDKIQKGIINKMFCSYQGNKSSYTFADDFNNFLGLPLGTERELPIITEENLKNANNEFKKLKVSPEKTILIIPDAIMFDYRTIDELFYKLLTDELKQKGYDIVFNTKLKEYKKFKNTFLDIMDFVAFAKQVKHTISIRSGITDLFVGMGINNLTALYPQNLEIIWAPDMVLFNNFHKNYKKYYDMEFENIFNIYSLNKIFKRNDIQEIIYNYDDKEIVEKIIKKINFN